MSAMVALGCVLWQCVYGPSVTWGPKSTVGIAQTDAGAGDAPILKKKKPKTVRAVTSSIW